MAAITEIRIVGEPFDPAALGAALGGGEDVGAVVSFAGYLPQRGRHARRARARTLSRHGGGRDRPHCGRGRGALALARLVVVHRHGLVRPGEAIVFVGTAAAHRGAAFAAAEFLMDFLKTRAPFWKKEHRVDGSDGGWVAAKDSDDVAAARWRD